MNLSTSVQLAQLEINADGNLQPIGFAPRSGRTQFSMEAHSEQKLQLFSKPQMRVGDGISLYSYRRSTSVTRKKGNLNNSHNLLKQEPFDPSERQRRVLGKSLSVMRRRVIGTRSVGNDSQRVDGRMASVVVPLDVLYVHGGAHSLDLEQVLRIVEQIRVLSDQCLVAFEVDSIDL